METLQKFPFQLSEEEAYLVSRYLIEDSNNQHVYVDKNNEQKRMVVKSILKALVGDYEILDEEKQALV